MASRHGIVSAEAAEDLRAVQSRLEAAPEDLRRLLHDTAAEQLTRAWSDELDKRPATPQQRKFVLDNPSATPHALGLWVATGHPQLWPPFEFGTNDRESKTTYVMRAGTKRVRVTRRTRRQLPVRRAAGYIAYPAANSLGTRAFNMWAELLRKVTGDAFDGGR